MQNLTRILVKYLSLARIFVPCDSSSVSLSPHPPPPPPASASLPSVPFPSPPPPLISPLVLDQAVSITKVWDVVMYGFEAMWPAGRTQVDGRNMGDVWEHSALPSDGGGCSNLVPFHKLSQWMTYSLMEPLQVREEWCSRTLCSF